jgi:phage/plasmid-like protein (TIGR03299 family)
MVAAVETMAYVGAVPWHGLGNLVDENISLDEFQKEAGLDWQVQKTPVQYLSGFGTDLTFKDKYVLNRTTDHRPFAVVSGRYKPVQPKEIFTFFKDLLDMHGMKMHTAGSLKDGGRIWCLAQTGDVHKVLGTDRVDGYLLLSTSYDLTLSTLAQFTSVRVVCNNTLQQALGDKTGRVTIPHVQEFNASKIKDQMGIGREQWQAFTTALDTLAKIKVDANKAAEIMDKIFEIPDDPIKRMADSDRIHAVNVVDLFRQGRFVGADLAGQTAWGLLNSTTEYIDHHKRARNQSNRIDSAWFGPGANLKERAMSELMLLAA